MTSCEADKKSLWTAYYGTQLDRSRAPWRDTRSRWPDQHRSPYSHSTVEVVRTCCPNAGNSTPENGAVWWDDGRPATLWATNEVILASYQGNLPVLCHWTLAIRKISLRSEHLKKHHQHWYEPLRSRVESNAKTEEAAATPATDTKFGDSLDLSDLPTAVRVRFCPLQPWEDSPISRERRRHTRRTTLAITCNFSYETSATCTETNTETIKNTN